MPSATTFTFPSLSPSPPAVQPGLHAPCVVLSLSPPLPASRISSRVTAVNGVCRLGRVVGCGLRSVRSFTSVVCCWTPAGAPLPHRAAFALGPSPHTPPGVPFRRLSAPSFVTLPLPLAFGSGVGYPRMYRGNRTLAQLELVGVAADLHQRRLPHTLRPLPGHCKPNLLALRHQFFGRGLFGGLWLIDRGVETPANPPHYPKPHRIAERHCSLSRG